MYCVFEKKKSIFTEIKVRKGEGGWKGGCHPCDPHVGIRRDHRSSPLTDIYSLYLSTTKKREKRWGNIDTDFIVIVKLSTHQACDVSCRYPRLADIFRGCSPTVTTKPGSLIGQCLTGLTFKCPFNGRTFFI